MAKKKNSKAARRKVKVNKVKRHAKPNNGMYLIDRVWAEMGVVRLITKDGDKRTYTPREAAILIQGVNQMPVSQWHEDHKNKLVEKVIGVIREARSQQEVGSSAKARAVTNVLQGKTAEGKEAPKYNDEDDQVQLCMFKYPLLDEKEIRAILRDTKLDMPRKLLLMGEVNTQRFGSMGFDPTAK